LVVREAKSKSVAVVGDTRLTEPRMFTYRLISRYFRLEVVRVEEEEE
jgi:hypothetical protein